MSVARWPRETFTSERWHLHSFSHESSAQCVLLSTASEDVSGREGFSPLPVPLSTIGRRQPSTEGAAKGKQRACLTFHWQKRERGVTHSTRAPPPPLSILPCLWIWHRAGARLKPMESCLTVAMAKNGKSRDEIVGGVPWFLVLPVSSLHRYFDPCTPICGLYVLSSQCSRILLHIPAYVVVNHPVAVTSPPSTPLIYDVVMRRSVSALSLRYSCSEFHHNHPCRYICYSASRSWVNALLHIALSVLNFTCNLPQTLPSLCIMRVILFLF